jgi:protein-S-isoprenylcysteine O-methyltransferase Ste14
MVHFSLAADPLPILLFWLNFCAWVVIWIGLVLRDRGSNVDVHTPSDQGSRTVIGISLWSGVLLAFLTAWAVPAAHIPGSGWPLLLGGLVLIWGGIALRVWAVRTLGPLFRTVVVIQDKHQLIIAGPYRLLRHPSYAGSLLTLAGIGLALGSWLSLLVAVLGALIGFTRRIPVEEAALQTHFGNNYTAYTRRTWRLVPFIW